MSTCMLVVWEIVNLFLVGNVFGALLTQTAKHVNPPTFNRAFQ